MNWLLPVTSPELVLGMLAIALFSSQNGRPFALRNCSISAITLTATTVCHYLFYDQFFSITFISLIMLALTGILVASKAPLPAGLKHTYSLAFVVIYGVSFFEQLFYTMNWILIASLVIWFLAVNLAIIFIQQQFESKVLDTSIRVLGSWIAAAAILLAAFFV